MRLALRMGLTAVIAACAVGVPALAAGPGDGGDVFRLYPGVAPGSEGARQVEVTDGSRVRNVTTPTLTVFRPRAGAATDAAVIIAPGGGFIRLSMDSEGYAAARRLAARGVTAIVLKYRLDETQAADGTPVLPRPPPNTSPGAHLAAADGLAAVRFVRAHARAWKIAPNRVGFLGFSAGAFVSMEAALSRDPASRADFAGAIYAPVPPGMSVPAEAPPLFLAVAADDKVVEAASSISIYQAWRALGRDVELHIFQSGSHGFGMIPHQKTSDHWIDEYLWWLEAPNGQVRLPLNPPG